MDTDALIAAACPTINEIGWTHYFAPETVAKGEAVGLDVFHLYFLGRGGVLGDVDASQVYSAFGYFNPALLTQMWDEAKAISDPRAAATLYMECCADVGRSRLSGIDGLEAFCETAGAINDAADPTGHALYAGIAAQPLVDDAPGRAMQLVSVLRELRGSAHLLAVRAVGLDTKTAHFIHRPGDIAMFGWSEADTPVITDVERGLMVEAEALTDRLVRPAYAVADGNQADAMVAVLDAMKKALTATS